MPPAPHHADIPQPSPSAEAPQEENTPAAAGGQLSYLLFAVVLSLLAIGWVTQNELIHASTYIGGSVPPIPALVAILALAATIRFARRWHRKPLLDRGQILRIFLLVSIAATLPSVSTLGMFFAYMTVPQYLSATQPDMARIASYIPTWMAPPPGEHIRRFYEGSPDGSVPWDVWIVPLLAWGVFLVIFMLVLHALLSLLRKSWMEDERLTYPLVQIPLLMTESGSRRPIWRSPVLWLGFGLAGAYNGMNMMHAFLPSWPAIGHYFEFSRFFVEKPWNALHPMGVAFRPEIIGIGYLMPTDVLLTTWVTYLLLRFSTVLRVARGEQVASGYYDYQEIGMGAFVLLFFILLRRAWSSLKGSLAAAWKSNSSHNDRNEPLSARAAWCLVLFGSVAMIVWLRLAGLPVWLGAAHLTLLIAVAIVYARMRAETGTPMLMVIPFWQQQYALTNFLGSQALSGGSEKVLTVFSSLGAFSRGSYPETWAYCVDGMSLAARAGFRQRFVTGAIIGGTLLGLCVGGYLYMICAYHYGFNQLDNGGTGAYRVYLATQQYNGLVSMMASPVKPKPDLIFQTILGGLIVVALNTLRQQILWFPFHPMGFAMASAYGYNIWGPFLIVWLIKLLVLRFAGHAGYTRFMPFFLGLALGHYLVTGIIWGGLGLFGHPATRAYMVQFG